MKTGYRLLGLVCGLLAVLCAAPGTASAGYGVVAAAGVDTVSTPLPDYLGGGTAKLFFYRITSLRTGNRLGVGRSFEIEEDRQVRAVLQLDHLTPGSELLLHFLWLNPDGLEVFTKELHVRAADWADPDKLEALHGLTRLDPEQGTLEVESRYGVGLSRIDEELHRAEEDRRFKPGTWSVRVYLFRKRLLESSFELEMPR